MIFPIRSGNSYLGENSSSTFYLSQPCNKYYSHNDCTQCQTLRYSVPRWEEIQLRKRPFDNQKKDILFPTFDWNEKLLQSILSLFQGWSEHSLSRRRHTANVTSKSRLSQWRHTADQRGVNEQCWTNQWRITQQWRRWVKWIDWWRHSDERIKQRRHVDQRRITRWRHALERPGLEHRQGDFVSPPATASDD